MLIGHSNLKKRDLVVEVGAGSGVITCALAHRVREVIAIEPDPQTAARLRFNLARRGLLRPEGPTGHQVEDSGQADRRLGRQPTKTPGRPLARALPQGRPKANVTVFEGDFRDFKLPSEPYKVFSNPPFHLSSELFKFLLNSKNPPMSIYLILQKQFALKLLNNTRHYTSQLGYQLTKNYDTKIRLPLKPSDFTPPPAVPTVFFEAKRNDQAPSRDLTV